MTRPSVAPAAIARKTGIRGTARTVDEQRVKRLVLLPLLALLALAAPAAQAAPGDRDPDGDRVDTRNELRQGTNPHRRDSDRDRRRDGQEDADGDGLRNAAEDAAGQDPADADSDNDRISDASENAGVVLARRGDRVKVRLHTGRTLTSRVTEDTDLGCGTEAEAERPQGSGPRRDDDDDEQDLSGLELSPEDLQDELDDDNAPTEDGDAEDGDDDLEVNPYWDESDAESQDDLFDFEDSCPARKLKAGTRVREASIDDAGAYDEIEFLVGR